ncbi:hypothetical protein CLIM01_14806 [Colletotrichum limetticola]|uniref:Secreted protein n=1 Tax=Colletotrichum limetticola TaxID=1209924 RepID=A0ABQ9P6T1_9PEZI|nr:hypothetical protein CLIM01_14806 [Colletotrichum limetticola]
MLPTSSTHRAWSLSLRVALWPACPSSGAALYRHLGRASRVPCPGLRRVWSPSGHRQQSRSLAQSRFQLSLGTSGSVKLLRMVFAPFVNTGPRRSLPPPPSQR